ncbi:MAG: cbb3-type cytochrome c oxidase subunit 3 [Burkholderiaceae bacterium]
MMDLNLARSIVMVLAFVLFIVLAVRTWRAGARGEHVAAAALPLDDEGAMQPSPRPSPRARGGQTS